MDFFLQIVQSFAELLLDFIPMRNKAGNDGSA